MSLQGEAMNRETTDYVIIHCTRTQKEARDLHKEPIGLRWVDEKHRKLGIFGVGYHFVILRDGVCVPGRSLEAKGVHLRGFNDTSIGICLVGGDSGNRGTTGIPEDNYTSEQLAQLADLSDALRSYYPGVRIVGAHDLCESNTDPAFDVRAWLAETDIRKRLKLRESNAK